MGRFSHYRAAAAVSAGGFGFFHRNRGVEESTSASTYYPARTSGTVALSYTMTVVCSAPTSVRMRWGNHTDDGTLVDTEVIGSLSAGSNPVRYAYTSNYDCRPENMGVALSARVPPEKFVQAYFSNPQAVTSLSFSIDTTAFDERGLVDTSVIDLALVNQSLRNLPPLPAGLKTLRYGNTTFNKNAIDFQSVREATQLCRNSLTLIESGSISTNSEQQVPFSQHYDLSIFPNLVTATLCGGRFSKLTATLDNAALETLDARQRNAAGLTDVNDFQVPPTLKTLSLGTAAVPSSRLSGALRLETARDLNLLELTNCYTAGGVTTQNRLWLYQSIASLWASPAATAAGVKVLKMQAHGDLSTPAAGFPNGITGLISQLTANGWSVTS